MPAPLAALDAVPVGEELLRVGYFRVAEDVRVASYEFLYDGAVDPLGRELTALGRHMNLEYDVEEDVAKLLGQLRGLALLDGLDQLVALLQELFLEGFVGLLAVPRASVGAAEAPDELVQAFVGMGVRLVAFHNLPCAGAAARSIAQGRLYQGAENPLDHAPLTFSAEGKWR